MRLQRGIRRAANVSLRDINQYISRCLLGLVQDTNSSMIPYLSQSFDPGELVTNVTPISSLKFMDISSTPFPNMNSNKNPKETSSLFAFNPNKSSKLRKQALKELMGNFMCLKTINTGHERDQNSNMAASSILSSQAIVRYLPKPEQLTVHDKKIESYSTTSPRHCRRPKKVSASGFEHSAAHICRSFANDVVQTVPHLVSQPVIVSSYAESNKFKKFDHPQNICPAITIATNNTRVVEPFAHTLDVAKEMFYAKAYTHHFHRYGFSDTCFMEAFETVESIVADYRSMQINNV